MKGIKKTGILNPPRVNQAICIIECLKYKESGIITTHFTEINENTTYYTGFQLY